MTTLADRLAFMGETPMAVEVLTEYLAGQKFDHSQVSDQFLLILLDLAYTENRLAKLTGDELSAVFKKGIESTLRNAAAQVIHHLPNEPDYRGDPKATYRRINEKRARITGFQR